MRLIGLFDVYKRDDVLLFIARELVAHAVFLRTIASYSNRLLGYFLANLQIGVGHCLRRRNFVAVCVNIFNGIAQGFLGPLGIDLRVGGDLRVPVEERGATSISVPTVERKASLGRVSGPRDLAVLLNRLRIGKLGRAVSIDELNRIARSGPLGVQRYIARRHRRKHVLRGQSRIGIPTPKRVITVYAALRSCRRPIVSGDVGVELDTGVGLEKSALIVVIDVVRIAIVIKIGSSPTIGTMIIRVADYLFWINGIAAGIVVCLTIRVGFCVAVIVCILQIIINSVLNRVGQPISLIRYGRPAAWKHIFG